MAFVPSGFIVAWPGSSSIPSGWSRATELDDYHPKGAAASADPGTTGGATTHTHTDPGHTHTISSHTHAGGTSGGSSEVRIGDVGSGALLVADTTHSHTNPTSGSQTSTLASAIGTVATSNNDPPYYTVRWIKSDGTPTGIPVGAWCYWDAAALPSGWSSPSSVRTKYLKGAATGANGGTTGGSSSAHTHAGVAHTHTVTSHSHSGGATGGANQNDPTQAASTGMATLAHTHTATFASSSGTASGSTASGTTGSTTAEVPYTTLGIIQNDNAAADFPIGVIGAWTGLLSAITLEFTICDGTGSTYDTRGKYIKGADVSGANFTGIGTTGGATTHDHTDPSTHTHTANHTHAVTYASGSASTSGTGGALLVGQNAVHGHSNGTSGSGGGTSGATAQTVDTANNEPAYSTVVWIKYAGSIDVTITSPTASQVLTSAAFTATWTLSSGTQSTERVIIYDSNQTTIVYDSGVLADTTASYDVPSTAGLRNNRTYYIQVRAVNNSSIPGASSLVAFSTSWTPPTTLSGLTLTNVGGT